MRKATDTLLLWFPDPRASCCSHHDILFGTVQDFAIWHLPSLLTHPPEQEANANLYVHFPSLPAAPRPHPDEQTLRGGERDREGVTVTEFSGQAGGRSAM